MIFWSVVQMKEISIVSLNSNALLLTAPLEECVVEIKKLFVRKNKFVSLMESLAVSRFVHGMVLS